MTQDDTYVELITDGRNEHVLAQVIVYNMQYM